MTLPPADPHVLRQAKRRRAVLTRGVSAVTQVGTAVALTSTGVVVGVLGHQAQVKDALAAQQRATPQRVVVVVKPIARRVRVVVVRRPTRVVLVPAPQRPQTRVVAPVRRTPVQPPTPVRRASAPKPTKAPAATKTTGS